MKYKADQWTTATAIQAAIRSIAHKAAQLDALFRQRLMQKLVSLKKASTIKESQNYTALSEKR